MENPILYRKRFIPAETIKLKDDVILECSDSILVTKWKALGKAHDFSHGYSCLYLKEGYKVSKFLKPDGSLCCWYCDIVTYDYNKSDNILTTIDLLADVIIYPDGKMKVADLDELSEAFEKKLIDESLLKKSLLSLNRLLDEIYKNGMDNLIKPIEDHIQN
ncbi:MAG: DUF402 domain-containing protein [Butyrivibrio sp.]|nr:DUF402 domain-containing protein [Butyrivibrio sp.]